MLMQTRYARSEGASIAYQIVGQGDVDIVLVPCWISHLERLWKEPRFVRFVERLSTFGRVILFDKRGTGLSDPVPASRFPSLDERMEDLLAVLDAVNSPRAVLFGSAIGGKLSALFAANHPDRVAALVTFGTSARGTWAPDYPWAPTPEEHEQRFARLQAEWGGPVMVETYASSLAHDPAFCRWWAECLRSGASPATAVAAERLSAEADIRQALPQIQAPTLILHRTGDRLVDLAAGRDLADRIPTAQFVELPGSDHLPFTGDQDPLFAALGGFLAEHIGSPSRLDHMIATVVVLDVLGIAETADRLGEKRWAEASDGYRRLVRGELARSRGQSFNFTLDGTIATFDGPARAVRFAKAVAVGMQRLGLRARIGVHTGEVETGNNRIGGMTIHLATRIAAQAAADEVIVSATVAGLVAGSGLSFTPVDAAYSVALPADFRLFSVDLCEDLSTSSLSMHSTGRLPTITAMYPLTPLTPRERQVVTLLTRGQSNREIGDDLSISVATAERHVSNIMTKLGVRSRAQIAAWAAGLDRGWETVARPGVSSGRTAYRLSMLAAD
jgi:pimeloyl-ACP methyl ester carboxylesterase/DNA-binding CsgD family transcriptional regulator/class 3 adenylate cyclase